MTANGVARLPLDIPRHAVPPGQTPMTKAIFFIDNVSLATRSADNNGTVSDKKGQLRIRDSHLQLYS